MIIEETLLVWSNLSQGWEFFDGQTWRARSNTYPWGENLLLLAVTGMEGLQWCSLSGVRQKKCISLNILMKCASFCTFPQHIQSRCGHVWASFCLAQLLSVCLVGAINKLTCTARCIWILMWSTQTYVSECMHSNMLHSWVQAIVPTSPSYQPHACAHTHTQTQSAWKAQALSTK